MIALALSAPRRPRSTLVTLLIAALGILPLGLAAASGAEIVDARRTPVTIEIERSMAVTVDQLRARILDFEGYEARVPIVQDVEILSQDPGESVVRFRYRVVRAGEFDLTRRFLHGEGSGIDFDSRDGSLGHLSGSWSFAVDPSRADHTLVRYRATLEPAFVAPDFLLRHVLKSEAPSLLDALVPAA